LLNLAKSAWQSAVAAIANMPLLVLTTFVALVVETYICRTVASLAGAPYGQTMNVAPGTDPSIRAWVSFVHVLISLPWSVLSGFTVAPLAVSVHRMVLTGAANDRTVLAYGLRDLRFGGFVAIYYLTLWAFSLASATIELLKAPGFLYLILLPIEILILSFGLRFALLFPATAMDIDNSGHISFKSTKGHGIRILFLILFIFGMALLTGLPIGMLVLGAAKIASLLGLLSYEKVHGSISLIFACGLSIFVTACMAATGSHLLRAYASYALDSPTLPRSN
jgi:hypothetical protein